MAFIYLTPTIGHKRIYNYKGRVLQREAFVLFSLGGFGLKHEKLMDLEYKEKHGKENTRYSLIFEGRMKIPVITATDIDKFNEFRLKVEQLLSNVGLESKFQQ